MICIFSYNRSQELLSTLNELQGVDRIIVIDDGSDYPETMIKGCEYYRTPHRGKPFFWKQWDLAFRICKQSTHSHFLFLPDDWFQFDTDRIQWIQKQFGEHPYAFNIANHGVAQQWTPVHQWKTTIKNFECFRVGFVDCCFTTNRATLEKIGWDMNPVNPERFKNPRISSGVGKQLSKRFFQQGVPMLKPAKSLCKKRDVPSQMNKLERKINPRPLL